jgi:ABC-type Fe3+-hydroxamate transport system substrate-binding protein
MIVMVEIAIVLCSVFLVAIPAIAADQTTQKAITTASEDDYVLGVYGNANEDDTMDMGDVVYTKLAIFGKKPKTELCDAKYDGRINVLDVIQTKLIILGKEKELTFVDGFGEAVTIRKPVERIVSVWCTNNELLKVLDATDKIVGIDAGMTGKSTTLFPEISALPNCGGWYSPDFEAILSQHPDMYISWFISTVEDTASHYGLGRRRLLEEKLPGVSILCIDKDYRFSAWPGVKYTLYLCRV